jgi:TRAP-type C4-dicarboxylate transport system permease small subunit
VERARHALDGLTNVLAAAGMAVVVVMALHIFCDILAKFLFNQPLAGTLEIVAHYYMVGLVFAPLAYVQHRRGHIAADFAMRVLGTRAQHAVEAVIGLVMALFIGLLVWQSGLAAIRSTAALEFVQTSGYFVYIFVARWFVPIGLAVMGLCALSQAVSSALAAARSG